MVKLTLSVEQHLVDVAKAYAKHHHTSLSRLVAGFFMELSQSPQDDFFTKLHEDLQREGFQAPKGDLHELRHRHVAKKYL